MGAGNSRTTPVKLFALGGLGEIGLNLMVLECAGHGLVVDCGVMFPEDRLLGNGVYIPDFSELVEKRVPIDAVGPDPRARGSHRRAAVSAAQIPGSRFMAPRSRSHSCAAVSKRPGCTAPRRNLRAIRASHRASRSVRLQIEPLRVTHSTPDSIALAIRTPAGIIVHSGDFKIDDAPVDGQNFDTEAFAALGEEGVALLLSDSTNVERAGRSGSESSLKPILRELISRTKNRFFLSAFSSHIHRIRQVAEVSKEAGRRVVPLGRRMAESVRLGHRDRTALVRAGNFRRTRRSRFHRAAQTHLPRQRQPGRAVLRAGEARDRQSSARARRERRHGGALVAVHSGQRALDQQSRQSAVQARRGSDLRRGRAGACFRAREPRRTHRFDGAGEAALLRSDSRRVSASRAVISRSRPRPEFPSATASCSRTATRWC